MKSGEKTMLKTYGQLTKAYRESKGFSLRKFAGMVGLSKSYLARLEDGEAQQPSLSIILATAAVMEEDPVAFMRKLGIHMDSPSYGDKKQENGRKRKVSRLVPFEYIPNTLENLQSALNEGRILILPFKAIRKGAMVYIPSIEYNMAIANEVVEVKGGIYTCESETLGRTEFSLFDVEQTVFSTRAGAVTKLQKMEEEFRRKPTP